jgi:predicted RNA binding protein YcfA (HicA-like mRNA interferase family)
LRKGKRELKTSERVKIHASHLDFFLQARKILRVSRKKKQLEKLRNSASDGNWTLAEVIRLLTDHGFTQTGGRGSHQVHVSPDYPSPIVLAPHGNQIKSGYIRAIREIIQP